MVGTAGAKAQRPRRTERGLGNVEPRTPCVGSGRRWMRGEVENQGRARPCKSLKVAGRILDFILRAKE